jgi:hypothetical protein
VRLPLLALTLAVSLARSAVPTGPNPGDRVPDFTLSDQNGAQRSLDSILGDKGALLVFFRSADW